MNGVSERFGFAHFGYFDNPEQTASVFDPGPRAPCPFCGVPLAEKPVKTISIMLTPDQHPGRSYFYRAHKVCLKCAAPQAVTFVEAMVMDEGVDVDARTLS